MMMCLGHNRKLGWRLGLQTITGVLFLAFFLGLIYRSASLYHPQRHAIVHLKNQQNKLKPKSKSALKAARQPLIDLSPLASRPVRMLMLAAGTASFGLYTPAFYIVSTFFPTPPTSLYIFPRSYVYMRRVCAFTLEFHYYTASGGEERFFAQIYYVLDLD